MNLASNGVIGQKSFAYNSLSLFLDNQCLTHDMMIRGSCM